MDKLFNTPYATARLDSFQQKLPDEKVSYLFISDADWEKARRKEGGRMVPILTVNVGNLCHMRATQENE